MTENEKRIYRQLSGRSNSMELLPGGQVSQSSGINAEIQQIVGNPAFKAEISLQVFVRYFSDVAAGGPATCAAAVPIGAQLGNLPLYVFGNIDAGANYTRARQVAPGGGGWDYANMAIIRVGSGVTDFYPIPAAVNPVQYPIGSIWFGNVLPGDLLFVIPMLGFVAGAAATTQRAEIIIRCPNVPYTSLLAALGSDLVTLNMIRYVVLNNAATLSQLAQQITLIKGSLFGKVSLDTLDPNTFITPGTFQPQIADIPITLPIDKNLIIASQIVYHAVAVPMLFTWTLTVSSINKLTQ